MKRKEHAGFVYLAIKDPNVKEDGQYLIHQCNFGGGGFQDENDGKDLESIFVFLHQYLIKEDLMISISTSSRT